MPEDLKEDDLTSDLVFCLLVLITFFFPFDVAKFNNRLESKKGCRWLWKAEGGRIGGTPRGST